MKEINEKNFIEEVIEYNGKVLVDFNADWCGPCKMLKPVLEKISDEDTNNKYVSVNVDENPELAKEYNVFSIPCLVVISSGKEINRSVGMISKSEIEKLMGE